MASQAKTKMAPDRTAPGRAAPVKSAQIASTTIRISSSSSSQPIVVHKLPVTMTVRLANAPSSSRQPDSSKRQPLQPHKERAPMAAETLSKRRCRRSNNKFEGKSSDPSNMSNLALKNSCVLVSKDLCRKHRWLSLRIFWKAYSNC